MSYRYMTEEQKKELIKKIDSFMVELYLNSEPKLDLKTLDHMVKPSNYHVKESVFNELLEKHNLNFRDVCFIMLNKGPKIKLGE